MCNILKHCFRNVQTFCIDYIDASSTYKIWFALFFQSWEFLQLEPEFKSPGHLKVQIVYTLCLEVLIWAALKCFKNIKIWKKHFLTSNPCFHAPNNGQSAVADGFLYFYFWKTCKKYTVKKGYSDSRGQGELVNGIPAGTGKIANIFLQCSDLEFGL